MKGLGSNQVNCLIFGKYYQEDQVVFALRTAFSAASLMQCQLSLVPSLYCH